jgi:hypothetical protein
MFKGIRQSKRSQSGDFTVVTSADLAGHEKENQGPVQAKGNIRKLLQQRGGYPAQSDRSFPESTPQLKQRCSNPPKYLLH